MRLAGTIHEENLARQFGIYLETQGIENRVELSGTAWEVWIRDDDHWPAAKSELDEFVKDPQAERFKVALTAAAQTAHKKQNRPQVIVIRHNTLLGHRPWITTIILILCIAVYFAVNMQMEQEPDPNKQHDPIRQVQLLQIHDRFLFEPVNFPKSETRRPFDAIRQGEFWRLFTSCLMHGSLMHILFNMMTLHIEGNKIERIRGPIVFAGLVLFTGIFSNTCQYLMNYYSESAFLAGNFAGFSGVLFGMFGYIWMKSRIEPRLGLIMTEQEVAYILGWTIICLVGLVPGTLVANTAHLSGAAAGMGLAWIGTMIRRAQGKA